MIDVTATIQQNQISAQIKQAVINITMVVQSGGASGVNFSFNETPSGTIDGSNTSFTLAHTPITNSLQLFLNGQRLALGVDYTLSGADITMTNAPLEDNTLIADYRY